MCREHTGKSSPSVRRDTSDEETFTAPDSEQIPGSSPFTQRELIPQEDLETLDEDTEEETLLVDEGEGIEGSE